jgi:hypothetical protein
MGAPEYPKKFLCPVCQRSLEHDKKHHQWVCNNPRCVLIALKVRITTVANIEMYKDDLPRSSRVTFSKTNDHGMGVS